MMEISRYEYKVNVSEQVLPSEETINAMMNLCGDDINKIPYSVLNAPAPNYDKFSFEETRKYSEELVDVLFRVAGNNNSESDKNICVALLLGNIHANVIEDLIHVYENVINYQVEDKTWQWIFRENLRYKLLVCYSKLNEFEKMKELITLLKPNSDTFNELWNSFLTGFHNSIVR